MGMHAQNQKHSKMRSTSFWESLPIADQQTFFFLFLHVPYKFDALHEPLLRMMEKVLFHEFQMFFMVFLWFSTMQMMHKHVFAGRNTQQSGVLSS